MTVAQSSVSSDAPTPLIVEVMSARQRPDSIPNQL